MTGLMRREDTPVEIRSAGLALCAPHVHIIAVRQPGCRRCPPWAFPP